MLLTSPVTPPGSAPGTPSLRPTITSTLPASSGNVYTPPPSPGANPTISGTPQLRPVTPLSIGSQYTTPASPSPQATPTTPLTTSTTNASNVLGAPAASTAAATTSTKQSTLGSLASSLVSVVSSILTAIEKKWGKFKEKATDVFGWFVMIKPTDKELIAKGVQTEKQKKEEELATAARIEAYNDGEHINKAAKLQRLLAFAQQQFREALEKLSPEERKAAEAKQKIFDANMDPI